MVSSLDFQYTNLKDLQGNFLQEVVLLHEDTFPQGLIKKLGREYVTSYYSTLVNSSQGKVILCLTPQKELAGFVSYTLNKHNNGFTGLRKKALSLATKKLLALQLNPLILLRAYLKIRRSQTVSDLPELMSIVVKEQFRGTGIGRKLVQLLEDDLVAQYYKNYCVFTDNEEGYQFYKKNNFEIVFEFVLGGINSACFKKRLKVESV